MTFSLAVAGKGGTGKTTLAAMTVRALCEQDYRPVLAVDADPNANLAEALGVELGATLAEIRERGSSPEGSPTSGVGRVRAVADEIHRAIVEADGFDLLTMGRPEGPRCYCYVNSLLRSTLDELARSYRAVVLDNEAGMEHLSRRTTNDVDVLLVVCDATAPAVRAARRIVEISRELPIHIVRRVLVVNRVLPPGLPDVFSQQLTELQAGPVEQVPYDEAVAEAGAAGQSIFTLAVDTPALQAVRRLVETLVP